MPSKTPKQVKFMRAVAHSPEFAKKVGVSQAVGKEFEMKDKKMKKYAGGGLAAGHKAADGIAKKGKTKAKMPKMAMGGVAGAPATTGRPASTGLARAAEMSGRTMPATGRPGMKKGGMAKKGCK